MTYFAGRPSEGKENEDITTVLVYCLYGSEDNTWAMLKPTHCLLLLRTCFKTCLYSEKIAQRRERRHELSFCLLKPSEGYSGGTKALLPAVCMQTLLKVTGLKSS